MSALGPLYLVSADQDKTSRGNTILEVKISAVLNLTDGFETEDKAEQSTIRHKIITLVSNGTLEIPTNRAALAVYATNPTLYTAVCT